MNVKNIVWWLLFLFLAITMQQYILGLDALLIGLIILLQESRYKDLIWFVPLIVILQEGMGSREFGGAIAWYTVVILFFVACRWLFEVRSAIFIILLSLFLGIAYFILAYAMAPLQELSLDYREIILMCVYQSIFIPLAWWVASLSRRGIYANEEKA